MHTASWQADLGEVAPCNTEALNDLLLGPEVIYEPDGFEQ